MRPIAWFMFAGSGEEYIQNDIDAVWKTIVRSLELSETSLFYLTPPSTPHRSPFSKRSSEPSKPPVFMPNPCPSGWFERDSTSLANFFLHDGSGQDVLTRLACTGLQHPHTVVLHFDSHADPGGDITWGREVLTRKRILEVITRARVLFKGATILVLMDNCYAGAYTQDLKKLEPDGVFSILASNADSRAYAGPIVPQRLETDPWFRQRDSKVLLSPFDLRKDYGTLTQNTIMALLGSVLPVTSGHGTTSLLTSPGLCNLVTRMADTSQPITCTKVVCPAGKQRAAVINGGAAIVEDCHDQRYALNFTGIRATFPAAPQRPSEQTNDPMVVSSFQNELKNAATAANLEFCPDDRSLCTGTLEWTCNFHDRGSAWSPECKDAYGNIVVDSVIQSGNSSRPLVNLAASITGHAWIKDTLVPSVNADVFTSKASEHWLMLVDASRSFTDHHTSALSQFLDKALMPALQAGSIDSLAVIGFAGSAGQPRLCYKKGTPPAKARECIAGALGAVKTHGTDLAAALSAANTYAKASAHKFSDLWIVSDLEHTCLSTLSTTCTPSATAAPAWLSQRESVAKNLISLQEELRNLFPQMYLVQPKRALNPVLKPLQDAFAVSSYIVDIHDAQKSIIGVGRGGYYHDVNTTCRFGACTSTLDEVIFEGQGSQQLRVSARGTDVKRITDVQIRLRARVPASSGHRWPSGFSADQILSDLNADSREIPHPLSADGLATIKLSVSPDSPNLLVLFDSIPALTRSAWTIEIKYRLEFYSPGELAP